MKRLLFILLLAAPIFCYGQLNSAKLGTITGKIIDNSRQQPIPYASVVLKNADGKIVTGTITTETGIFIIHKIPYDSYMLIVQFMGYKSHKKKIVISAEHKKIELGTISLKPSVSELEGVVVNAERTTIEQLIDRKVIHVGKDLSSSGSSAAEIMNKIPSVRVDMDGKLYLRGEGNVRVLVDGKPTNIPVSTLLQQIPASSIEKIELITNPSAKYSPEGMSGIVNIVLKKNANMGFNGVVSGGITLKEHLETDASLNLNYRTGKLNFYTNLGVNYGEEEKIGFINEINGPAEDLTIFSEDRGQLVKFGMDYYLNDNNVISVYTNQNFVNEDLSLRTDVSFPQDPIENYTQDLIVAVEGLSSTYNLNAKHDFEKEGHTLELEMDYNVYDSDESSDYVFSGNPSLSSYEDIDKSKRVNFISQVDYVNPISETIKLEFGAEARLRKSENDYTSINTALQDVFYDYQEDIYSAYGIFNQNFEHWAYQIGLRFENFTGTGKQDGIQVLKNESNRLYPSAYVTYTPNDVNSFQVSYSRRINRPSFWQLNPTRNFATTRITSIGNPELKPELTDAYEVNYTLKIGKARLRAGVFYRFMKDNFTQIMYEDPENPQRLIMTYGNTGDKENYGIEASAFVELLKLWDMRLNLNTYSYSASGIIGSTRVEEENTMVSLSTNNSFDVTDNFQLQLFAMYRSPVQTLQFRIEEMYFVNLGARYSFWNDKASVNVNFNDIFDTKIQKLSTERPVPQVGQFKSESQYVQIGFSYRFGDGKNRKRNREEINHNAGGGGLF